MTYVITQNCCNDASCVAECPVDCIRPSPDDREAFAAAEMLYIDPDSCIDCGACMEACPVGAVSAEDELPDHLARFAQFNAEYFVQFPLTGSSGSPRPPKPDGGRGELSVAVVGAGPSGAYVLEELLERGNVKVAVYDALPTPWGLLRSGVAPDHQHTKNLAALFEKASSRTNVSVRLNVPIGDTVSIDQLRERHHAVVLATGAADAQPWEVPGADLVGVHPASDFVAWYNGHPDKRALAIDLTATERAVIVGNGNVALDMARVLLMTPDELARTDVADHALDALAASAVREVVVVGRRGPLQAAYTSAEFHALAALPEVDVVIDPDEARLDDVSRQLLADGAASFGEGLKARLAGEYAAAQPRGRSRRLVFRYLVDPVEVLGEGAVRGLALARTQILEDGGSTVAVRTEQVEELAAGLVLTSVGYRGRALPGVSFDERTGTIPSLDGRVVDQGGSPCPGLYVTGWIRRGATGGLGSSRLDAAEVVDHIVRDFNDAVVARITDDDPPGLGDAVDLTGWRSIDVREREAGRAVGRPRVKLVSIEEMVDAARHPVA